MLSLAYAQDDVDKVRTWVTTIGNPEWDTLASSAGSPPGQLKPAA
jgi:L-asparaginase